MGKTCSLALLALDWVDGSGEYMQGESLVRHMHAVVKLIAKYANPKLYRLGAHEG